MIAFIVLENMVLLFIFINWLASNSAKTLRSYQIVRMDVPNDDEDTLVRVKLMYYRKEFDLMISKASMKNGKYQLGSFIELPA